MPDEPSGHPPLSLDNPKDNFADLELRELPGMVRWFSPSVLLTTARQAVLSGAFGSFADQRTMQAAVDDVTPQQAAQRYDYRSELAPTGTEPLWVDYVADVGDGFEPTYAVACQLAKDQITVNGYELPAGKILIMGGDQVYPYPNREDYIRRMHYPYELACPVQLSATKEDRNALRKLFVLPGNHDWYDGLVAFDYFFCGARQETDGSPSVEAKQIGRWWCPQHRSYFALRLPHNWWIWGADIQLSQYLDVGQIQYFKHVAETAPLGPDDKVIICVAEPSWLPEHQTQIVGRTLFEEQRSKLARIGQLITQKKATVCTIVAGDNHHYSRYFSAALNVNLITAGGGGAYLHPTHQLEPKIQVRWGQAEYPFTLRCKPVPGRPNRSRSAVFPSRQRSRMLAWRNLAFPFLNPSFALGLGLFYWLITWLFSQTYVPCQLARREGGGQSAPMKMRECLLGSEADPPALRVRPTSLTASADYAVTAIAAGVANFVLAAFGLGLLAALITYADSRNRWAKVALGSVHWLAHILAMIVLYLAITIWTYDLLWSSQIFTSLLGTRPLSGVQSWLTYPQAMVVFYPILCTLIGGFVAAMIWGLYLLVCCIWGPIHWDHAFSALRIPDYKSFLRFKLEPDKLTIYPIGLRKVPRRPKLQQERPGWWPAWLRGRQARILWTRSPAPGGASGPHYFVPPRSAVPELIEPPIEINVSQIRNA